MNFLFKYFPLIISLFIINQLAAQELFKAPKEGTHTRWVSPENPTGEKGQGGRINKGAKGNAFIIVAPGEKQKIFDVEGPGIVQRMWMSGSIAANSEQRRAVKIDMYWDGASKPAVSAPIGDFFGNSLGLMTKFDNELFSNPEGRSFNFTIPMPFHKSAFMEIINESSSYVLFWYDINFLKVDKLDDDILYFHAYWNRTPKTELGKDYAILPKVQGKGRYLGTSIGVIGNPAYQGTWFGEGEVKIFLDGDLDLPTLVGTGTEDYIGTGWGQGEFQGQYFGSLVSDNENDLYAFYRYHIKDAVYFHQDCKVTIQQMGNAPQEKLKDMISQKAELEPVWAFDMKGATDIVNIKGERPEHIHILDLAKKPDPFSNTYPKGGTNFYRRDDVSATAYFYLDKPQSNLPELPPVELRLQDMQEKVYDKKLKK